MTKNQAIVDEGDPNEAPWRNRPGGPTLEWSQVSELKVGEKVMQGNKVLFRVAESQPGERGLWRLVIDDPEVAPTSASSRPQKLSPYMPKRRQLLVDPKLLYRRVAAGAPDAANR